MKQSGFRYYKDKKTGKKVKIKKVTRHYRFAPETTIEVSYLIWNDESKSWDFLPEGNFNKDYIKYEI